MRDYDKWKNRSDRDDAPDPEYPPLDKIYCPDCGECFDTDFSVPDYVYCAQCDRVLRTND